MGSIATVCLLLLLPAASAGGQQPVKQHSASELAVLASAGDAVQLWQRATVTAAAAVVEALRQRDADHNVELKGIDLEELRIWHGQSVALGLEADKQRYSFVVQSEPEWRRLAEVLPAAEGGLLPKHDWDSIDRDWLSPVSRGSQLADFALEGPVDVFLSQPTALQLYLPHASDAGQVQRVLLREGATVVVRGARAVRLRRGLDLPAISLSEFADIVTSDAKQQQPLGVMHLLAGVQAAAAAHWNSSHPDTSLGLVALELEFSPRGATLLAAPGGEAGSQRLRVRRVKPGVIELLPRDGPPLIGPQEQQDRVVAVASKPSRTGVWPLRSVHETHLQSYERLLRQVISSRLFQADTTSTSSGGAGRQGQPALRVAQNVQLRLLETEAEATTLLQLQIELERRPKVAAAAAAAAAAGPAAVRRTAGAATAAAAPGARGAASRAAADGVATATAAAAAAGAAPTSSGHQQQEAGQLVLDPPPDPLKKVFAEGNLGPHETWTATVQIKGDGQRGTLKFVPLHLQRVGASHDTVQLSAEAIMGLLGNKTGVFAAVV